jgi:phosphate starvation-inducible protein PhoH and related proteins
LSKNRQKNGRRTRSFHNSGEVIPLPVKFRTERTPDPIVPLNQRQAEYLDAIKKNQQIVVMGPAGTGKTFIAATYAADQLRQRKIKKIILTRPNVPGGRSLGFFPGTLEEKFGPWLAQVIADIEKRMGKGAFEIAVKNGSIEMIPFEVMRGRSFDDCFILLDEAQNTTPEEIKMFLTRQGENSTTVINGDISQSDLKSTSGLSTMIHLIKKRMLPVPIVEFSLNDIVRSDICAMWVRAFHAEGI